MRDPLLAIEVHEVARAFRLRTRLKELGPEVVPGDGDTWHVRVASRQSGMEVHEALTRVPGEELALGLAASPVRSPAWAETLADTLGPPIREGAGGDGRRRRPSALG